MKDSREQLMKFAEELEWTGRTADADDPCPEVYPEEDQIGFHPDHRNGGAWDLFVFKAHGKFVATAAGCGVGRGPTPRDAIRALFEEGTRRRAEALLLESLTEIIDRTTGGDLKRIMEWRKKRMEEMREKLHKAEMARARDSAALVEREKDEAWNKSFAESQDMLSRMAQTAREAQAKREKRARHGLME